MQELSKTTRTTALLLFVVLLVVSLIRSPIGSSLWLDELLSAWIVNEGPLIAWHRAMEFQATSPLYFVALSLWAPPAGGSELLLRLPSVLCFAASCYVLFVIAKKLFDAELAVVTLSIFIALDPVMTSAIGARPYAATLLCALLSFNALVGKEGTFNLGRPLVWFCASVFMFYMHYLSVSFLLIEGLFLWRTRDSEAIGRALKYGAFLLIAMLPGLYHLYLLGARSGLYGTVFEFYALSALSIAFPPYLVVSVILATTCGMIAEKSWFSSEVGRDRIFGLAVWAVVPVLFLVALSYFSGRAVLLDRYALWAYPGCAMLGASLLRSQRSPAARTLALVVLGCFLLVRTLDKRWHVEDWRSAVGEAQSQNLPIFLNTGLVEGRSVEWLSDPTKRGYFLSPVLHYGTPAKVLLLPYSMEIPEAAPYLDREISKEQVDMKSILVMCLASKATDCAESYFGNRGLHSVETRNFGLIRLTRWEKD